MKSNIIMIQNFHGVFLNKPLFCSMKNKIILEICNANLTWNYARLLLQIKKCVYYYGPSRNTSEKNLLTKKMAF